MTVYRQLCADIKKQVHELATSVYQIRGHIKGKTLLPFPQVSTALVHSDHDYVHQCVHADHYEEQVSHEFLHQALTCSYYVAAIL